MCTKNPELGSVIPHHMEIIPEKSRVEGNWQYYDIEFRKLLERGEAQWGCTHLELYLRAKLQVNVKSENDNTNKSGNTRWSIGVCFSFHKCLGSKTKPDIVRRKILNEISANRFVGPFDSKPFTEMQLSHLGLAEKKLPGTYRMIYHLSFPEGSSINDSIPQEKCSVQYASIQDAIELIKIVGRKGFCAKTDISSAFRIINIKESQYDLFGFMWDGKYYYDKNLQMGCSPNF
ncbi:unnamed protein product [Mytilus coruscus]|uniref:Reverse transcriptase domain-containing protein n=1 Tax=Mytilus coruscus TaxID=42192 RepID=A0A6J8DZR8_MYTCO|nr:unnamed protein product [Mytilus coruscus]